MTITGEQVRCARHLLRWTLRDLSFGGRIGETTLADFESGKAKLSALQRSVMRAALESAGVEFIAKKGGGAGVRLRKQE
jgi:hypothetical protein